MHRVSLHPGLPAHPPLMAKLDTSISWSAPSIDAAPPDRFDKIQRQRRPSFSGISQNYSIVNNAGQGRVSQTTFLMREPEVLLPLSLIIRDRFPQGTPIHCFAASDGSDPWSLAKAFEITDPLVGSTAEATTQRYPILASDLDAGRMAIAQQGLIECAPDELTKAQGDLDHFQRLLSLPDHPSWKLTNSFTPLSGPLPATLTAVLDQHRFPHHQPDYTWHQVQSSLHNRVQFRPGEIMSSLNQWPDATKADSARAPDTPSPQPCVILARNFWIYYGDTHPTWANTLAQTLGQKCAPGSLLVIGELELPKSKDQLVETVRQSRANFPAIRQVMNFAGTDDQLEAFLIQHLNQLNQSSLNPVNVNTPQLLTNAGFRPLEKKELAPFFGEEAEGRIWVKRPDSQCPVSTAA